MIERHEKLFGQRPVVLAADKGFCPEKSKFEELAKLVVNLAIPRRMQDFMDKLLASCQAFRRDRGHYFRVETRVSLGSLFFPGV